MKAASHTQRALVPHEHGAYGQLLFPMITALAIGRPGTAAFAWAAAAALVFLAHEPVMVLLGQRGPKASRDERPRTWRWLGVCSAGVMVFGLLAFARMPNDARVAVAA